ncbi:MAG TPA: PPOX class F420-dependent oxidoreductase [Chloroflexota bacterium]|nr:PPOX class F420-dependent oxidoreductase [Chloroflexota bacterium]
MMEASKLAPQVLDQLRHEKYISLTSYRRNGEAVATPIWFAVDGDRIVAFTGAQTGKAKRIRANPSVGVAPCSLRGRVKGSSWQATARILPGSDGHWVMALIRRKYRVTKALLDLLVGIIRLVRRRPQSHSVYLEITLDPAATDRTA